MFTLLSLHLFHVTSKQCVSLNVACITVQVAGVVEVRGVLVKCRRLSEISLLSVLQKTSCVAQTYCRSVEAQKHVSIYNRI